MDREKVIEALHCRGQDLMIDLPACDGCDYQIQLVNRMGCDYRQICRDALALLKEQEAELSYRKAKAITHTATKLDDATCPSCGNVVRMRYDYCHYCGQKLYWEGR